MNASTARRRSGGAVLRNLPARLVRRAVIAPVLTVGGVLSLLVGSGSMRVSDLLVGDPTAWRLLLASRIPRLLSVLLVGAGLAVAGLILQSLMRNRFASPGTAATVDGARFGFVISVLAIPHAPVLVRTVAATAAALGATGLFVFLIGRVRYHTVVIVPLLGLILGSVLDAGAEALAYRFDLVQTVSSWLVGDFSMIVQGRYEILLVSVPLVVLAYRFSRRITVAGLGAEVAGGLGLDYRATMVVAVLLVSTITAVAVVIGGDIPFVGLIVPNLVSLARGDNVHRTLPETALLGAAFLLATDVLSRVVIHPYEVPIGLTVGVVGSGAFLILLLKGRPRSA